MNSNLEGIIKELLENSRWQDGAPCPTIHMVDRIRETLEELEGGDSPSNLYFLLQEWLQHVDEEGNTGWRIEHLVEQAYSGHPYRKMLPNCLNLSDSDLESLPPVIFQMGNLKELNLDNNELSELSPEIGNLTSLQLLDLDDNSLPILSPEIGLLKNLEWLNLNGNRLSSLPVEFWQLTGLQWLHLGHNLLRSLPPEICQLAKLEALFLGGNSISSYDPMIAQLQARGVRVYL